MDRKEEYEKQKEKIFENAKKVLEIFKEHEETSEKKVENQDKEGKDR